MSPFRTLSSCGARASDQFRVACCIQILGLDVCSVVGSAHLADGQSLVSPIVLDPKDWVSPDAEPPPDEGRLAMPFTVLQSVAAVIVD